MQIVSVRADHEEGVYFVELSNGTIFVSRPSDPYGIGPEVRTAVKQWIADGNPVLPAE